MKTLATGMLLVLVLCCTAHGDAVYDMDGYESVKTELQEPEFESFELTFERTKKPEKPDSGIPAYSAFAGLALFMLRAYKTTTKFLKG